MRTPTGSTASESNTESDGRIDSIAPSEDDEFVDASGTFNDVPIEDRPMITGRRMAAVDENAAALGVSRRQLMESSGNAVARTIREVASPGEAIVFVAGTGNNGGDAFVAARFLEDYDVTVLLLGRPSDISTPESRGNFSVLESTDVTVTSIRDSTGIDLPSASVIVDALLGTGIQGEVREPVATAVRAINDHTGTVVSVDVPSGLDTTSGELASDSVDPDYVVTFHDEKPGLDSFDATVTIADIGIPTAAERTIGPGDLRSVRQQDRQARVFVIGGGPYAGAPTLAAKAALRAGAELAFLAVPNTIAGEVQGFGEDLIVQPFDGEYLEPDHVESLVSTAHRYDDIVVLGPGLGRREETADAVERFLETFSGRCVVDADAVSALPNVDTDATVIATPNIGELAMLGDAAYRPPHRQAETVASIADSLGHVVVAKGPEDVISDGERTRTVPRGHPGMAVGGTGDVLAGIVAAFLDEIEPFRAAGVAAYVNALAGERLGSTDGTGFLASELLEELPSVIWQDASPDVQGDVDE